jgi:hypothetical protein
MLGDVGAELSPDSRSNIHHLPRGNASMTPSQKTALSAILVYDCHPQGRHALFPNPYAAHPVPDDWLPGVRRVAVDRTATEEQLTQLSEVTFWCCDEQAP